MDVTLTALFDTASLVAEFFLGIARIIWASHRRRWNVYFAALHAAGVRTE